MAVVDSGLIVTSILTNFRFFDASGSSFSSCGSCCVICGGVGVVVSAAGGDVIESVTLCSDVIVFVAGDVTFSLVSGSTSPDG